MFYDYTHPYMTDDERTLVRRVIVPHTGPANYETVSCAIDNVSGERGLFLVFTGADTDVSLSWFSFTRPE